METQVGQPVQFYEARKDTIYTYVLHPAIISHLDGGKNTELRIFPSDGGDSYVAIHVKHQDFRKDGESFWKHLDEVLKNKKKTPLFKKL